MSTQTIHEVLQQEIEALSPALVEEILDFVLFCNYSGKEIVPLLSVVKV